MGRKVAPKPNILRELHRVPEGQFLEVEITRGDLMPPLDLQLLRTARRVATILSLQVTEPVGEPMAIPAIVIQDRNNRGVNQVRQGGTNFTEWVKSLQVNGYGVSIRAISPNTTPPPSDP